MQVPRCKVTFYNRSLASFSKHDCDGWTDGQMDRWKDDGRQRDFELREPPVQREKKERAKHICRRGRKKPTVARAEDKWKRESRSK